MTDFFGSFQRGPADATELLYLPIYGDCDCQRKACLWFDAQAHYDMSER